jgi:tetratricopeptide (TPR) repeat protein
MSDTVRRALVVLVVAGTAATLLAASAWAGKPEPEPFSEKSVGAGLSAGLGLLQLHAKASEPSVPLPGYVFAGPRDVVTRLLVDDASGTVFGYRMETKEMSSTMLGVLRIDLRPLDATDHEALALIAAACPQCPTPHLASSSTRFPPAQIVRDGETLVIDLLVHPQTGDRVVDVVTFSFEPVTADDLDKVRDRVARAFEHVRKGDTLAARGTLEPAVAEYRSALALQPDAATHTRLAAAYLRLGRTEAGEREYERAVQRNAGDAENWHSLAVLRHRAGRYGKAVSAYERALKLRADWALARRNLATAHLDRADVDKAYAEYKKAHRASAAALETSDALVVKAQDAGLQQYVLARVYASAGLADHALSALQRAKDAGFGDLERVREDAEFRGLLQDPRLPALLARNART